MCIPALHQISGFQMSLLFRYFTVLTWLLGCGCLTSTSLGRQIQVPTPLTDSFEAGIQAFKTGQYEIAIAHFNEVFEASPGYIQRDVGSVAFWLGRTYEAIDNPLDLNSVVRKNPIDPAVEFTEKTVLRPDIAGTHLLP